MQGFIDQVSIDMVINGVGHGPLAQEIASGRMSPNPQVGFDPGMMRPVIQNDGQKYVKLATGRMVRNDKGEEVPERKYIPLQRMISNGMISFTANATSLPYQTWLRIDRAVIRASRDRLQAWNDLAAVNTFSGFDGMAVTAITRDSATDSGAAKVTMEKLDDDFNDAAQFLTDIIPLPMIHAGSSIPARRLAMSRNSGLPLDTEQIEQATRRCTETLEDITIGITDYSATNLVGQSVVPAFTNKALYGFRTQPNRIQKSDITTAATGGGATLVTEVLAMVELARAQKFFGPFLLYYSTDWDQFLGEDYLRGTEAQGFTTVDKTVLQRVEMIRAISRVAMLDRFTSTSELLLVQQDPSVMRAIVGMEFTPVQWEKPGTGETMIRVLGIKVPDLKSQFVGLSTTSRKAGIVHGTTS